MYVWYVPRRFFLWGVSSDSRSDLCSLSDEDEINSVTAAAGSAGIDAVAGMDEEGINVNAGGAGVEAGDEDVDARIPVLTRGTGEGATDFLFGRPTGLFFMVERSIGSYLRKNLGHWMSLILRLLQFCCKRCRTRR